MQFNLTKLLFFDIETVSQYQKLEQQPETLLKMWEHYFTNFEGRVTVPERLPEKYVTGTQIISDEYKQEVYEQTAAFFPEFGKVACVSMAFVTKEGKIKFESFYGENEKEILDKTRVVFDKIGPLGFSLCGQNIKGFDIPFLGKRFVINGIKVPSIFPTHDTKPWELMVLDTKDLWSFGSKWGLGSLDLICASLNVDSPKNGDVKGDSVTSNYWGGKHEEIKEYCEKDVKALIDILEKFNGLK